MSSGLPGLPPRSNPGRPLDTAYDDLREAIKQAHAREADVSWLTDIIGRGLSPTVDTDYERWQPLHWVLEAPDVVVERSGFDAVVGNPPFLGGQKLTGAMGSEVRDWLVEVVAGGARGSADLVAYFFLRAFGLLAPTGTLGLVATNTIAQGDTRAVGLDQLVQSGVSLTRAIQSRSWPAASASLQFAAVWGTRADVGEDAVRISDGAAVPRISTLLEPGGRVDGQPVRLGANAGVAFQGCIVLGSGFVLEEDEARLWLDADPSNTEVLHPYLNGDDLNSRPDASASRWVIDFFGKSLAEAKAYEIPFARVRDRVKPERDTNSRKARRENWWLFAENAVGLRRAKSQLDEVLAITRHSSAVMMLRVPSAQVFSDATAVFALDSFSDQAVLSSSVHQAWAIKYSSTIGSGIRYTPSDVFETFPRPDATQRLEATGKTLDRDRRAISLTRDLGVTQLYNLVNDSSISAGSDADVARLREIHVALDESVMDAYGGSDLQLDHGFHTYRQMERWTVSPTARVEILDRLLEENHRRAAMESQGPRPTKGRSTTDPPGTERLFS